MSLTFRLLTPSDFPIVDPLLTAAYDHSTSMLDDLAQYHQLQPDGWLLVMRNERPVGIGGALLYDTFARIGLVAVLPEVQRQGIGVAIMQQLLEWIAQRGATTVLLDATPVGVPLYSKLGFTVDDSVCAYIQRRSSALVDTSAIAIKQLEPKELPEVVIYDAQRFGAQRSGVLTSYNEAFPNRTFVARDSQGTIRGYILAQAHRLGPWLADTPEIAEALLLQALQLSFSQSPKVIVPEYNQDASSLLKRAGFMPEQYWQSMCLGGISDLQRRQWLYGYGNLYVG